MTRNLLVFNQIASSNWEHPSDKLALNVLKKVPGLDALISAISKLTTDTSLRLLHLSSAIRVGPNQLPSINTLLEKACEVLDHEKVELFVTNSPIANAGAMGIGKPFIVLHSGLVEQLSQDELLFVIGHELGHIASGHSLYRTVISLLLELSANIVGFNSLITSALMAILLEWYRKSELSADRAGLLVCQNIDAALNCFMKMAGGAVARGLNQNEFIVQASEYAKSSNLSEDIFKIVNIMRLTHPFPVLRLSELKPWHDGPLYKDILAGHYQKRIGSRCYEYESKPTKDFAEAQANFKKDYESQQGPIKEGIEYLKTHLGNLFK